METKEQIIDRQISIREKQTALHSETQQLISDILNSMTKKQLKRLFEYDIDSDRRIIGDISSDGFLVEVFEESEEYVSIGNLSQFDQKELIDFILNNNLTE